MKIWINKHQRKTAVILTMTLVFFWEFLGCISVQSITNNSSEFNVIAMAAGMAGLDWKSTILGSHYYGFTSSLIFSVIFFIKPIVSNAGILLHSLLFINIFINSFCALLLFLIIEQIYIDCEFKLDYMLISLMTAALSLFLSGQVLSKTVTNENFLVLCFYSAVYFLLRIYHIKATYKKVACTILLSAVSILAYATNGRGIILIGIVFVILVYFFISKKMPFHTICVYLLTLGGLYILFKYGKNIIINTFYNPLASVDTPLKNDDINGILDRGLQLLNFTGIQMYIKLLIGWGEYFVISTYGLGIVSIVASMKAIYRKFIKKEQVPESLFLLSAITVLFLTAITILGICFYHDSFYAMLYDNTDPLADSRVDKLIYGRYISTIKPIIIAEGLIYLIYENNKNLKEYVFYVVSYLTLSLLFVHYIVRIMIGKKCAIVDIPEFALFFEKFETNYKYGRVDGTAFGIVICLILLLFIGILLLAWEKHRTKYWLIVVILASNMIMGFLFNKKLFEPRSKYYTSLVKQDYVDMIKSTYPESGTLIISDANSYLYQFLLPYYKIIELGDFEAIDPGEYDRVIFLDCSEKEILYYINSLPQDMDIALYGDKNLATYTLLLNGYEKIFEENNTIALKRRTYTGETITVTIPAEYYYGNYSISDTGSWISDGTNRIICYGPYLEVPNGKYTIKINLKHISGDGDAAGYVVIRNNYEEDLYVLDINSADFFEEMQTMTIEILLPEGADLLECCIYPNEGHVLSVQPPTIIRNG
jgi:hypothetical protein